MKNYLLSLIALLFIIEQTEAQIITKTPSWIVPITFTNTAVNKNLVKDGYYYLMIDEQYNTVKGEGYFHYALSAITEEALVNVSQFEFKFDPSYQKGVLHKVIVHRNGVSSDRTRSIDLKQLNEESGRDKGVLSGKKTLYANFSDIRKGDIVEYSYSIVGTNPVMKNYFDENLQFSYSVPVGKIFLRFLISGSTEPTIIYNQTTQKPVIKGTDVKDYSWEVNDPVITKVESSTPDWYNPYPSIQISNLGSWKMVKDHCRSLFVLPAYDKTELKEIADSVIKTNSDIELQITSMIEFVQTHVRYSGNENGIYSHIPRSPAFVIKNRYGDCKEKSVLLCELLKQINIIAYPVLVNTYRGKKTMDRVPSINAFDHCIAMFKYDGQIFFIDPTISSQRGHFKLRSVPYYEIGMILDESDELFTEIPVSLLGSCSVLEEFFVEKNGDTRLKVRSTYTGSDADNIRYYFLVNSIYDIQDSYKVFYSKFTENISVLDTVKFEDHAERNEFVTIEDYMLEKFWTPVDASKSKTINKDFMPYALNQRLVYGEEVKRKDPLNLAFPVVHTHTMIVIREGGWTVDYSVREENNKYFSYRFITKAEGEKLELKYAYNSKTNVVSAKDYLDYREKMDFINLNMVFTAQENPLVDGVIGFNWPLLLTMLLGLAVSIALAWNMSKRKFNTGFSPKYNSIGGWLIIVAIGSTLNPIILLVGLLKEYYAEWDVNYLVFFFDEKSNYFSPLKGYYCLFVPFFNILFIVLSAYLVVLFFQRKNSFRTYYSIFKISNVIFLISNVIILHFLYSDSTIVEDRALLSSQTTAMVRTIVGTAIWVPYVWYSERSRHTFTEGNVEALVIADKDGVNDNGSTKTDSYTPDHQG